MKTKTSPISKTTYKLWNNISKSFFYDLEWAKKHNSLTPPVLEFSYPEEAEKFKNDYLEAGNYIDRPHTVISIWKFVNDRFRGDVTI